ncbi:MAG: hypothetical protein HUU37_01500 [Bdellovibrionales bacterium]|nr:hypothetical protein [Bdellovibrionales bacterium]
MKKILVLLPILTVVGCSSSSKTLTPENSEDKILSRIDDRSSRPSWLKEAEPFRFEDGEVVALGSTTIPGDNRVEAAYRIAENNAKGFIAGAIEQRLEFIFQNAEEGTALDTTQARYIGAEAAKIVTSSIRLKDRYWEKVATTQDSGQRVTQYKVFATVSIPEEDFKRAIIDAAKKREGRRGLSSDFAEKVNKHWDQFTGAKIPSSQADEKEKE